MSLAWRVVAIERWPGELTKNRIDAPFSTMVNGEFGSHRRRGVDWTGTQNLLARELDQLAAREILLQMAVTTRDLRQDGWIRADCRPQHPGVILSFLSKHGPLTYPCDTFKDWQANVRAIALSLEALRKVDRYGVSRRGEQYTGWGKLPPAGGSTATLSVEAAATIVAYEAGDEDDAVLIMRDADAFRGAYREATKGTHPDREGGSTEAFQRLQTARAVLERHHGIAGK